MYAFTYRVYWKEKNATNWNTIESSSPISWIQEVTPASQSNNFIGGQCPSRYQVKTDCIVTVISCSNGAISFSGPIDASGLIDGPIGGIFIESSASGACGSTGGQVLGIDRNGIRTGLGFLAGTSNLGNRVQYTNVVHTVTPVDGQADNCGNLPAVDGSCKTTFSTGLIITKPECIEVSTEIPECPCCAGLLPKANAILARL